jgi:hypothetical protein
MYLLNTGLGVRQFEVAEVAGVSPAAVCQALRIIEDLRELPHFDVMLEDLERQVIGSGQPSSEKAKC